MSMIIEPGYIELSFYHIAAKIEVSFKAFIEDYKDQYASDWENTPVYGRMDPIGTFKGTSRKVVLAWKVPANSFDEAKANFYKAQTLMSMLYPVYDSEEGLEGKQPVLKAAPLLKVKLGNLIIKSGFDPSLKAGITESGLVCSAEGFTFDPEMEEGFFFQEKGNIYPQTLKFGCTLQIYHDIPLGWNEEIIADGGDLSAPLDLLKVEGRKRQPNFPYSAGTDPEFVRLVKNFAKEKQEKINNDDTMNNTNLKQARVNKIVGK